MLLLDEVVSASEGAVTTRIILSEDSPFMSARGVPAAIGLEYLAQSAAAYFGLKARDGEAPRAGMLVACRQYSCERAFFSGTLNVEVSATSALPNTDAPGLVKFSGLIREAEQVVAQGELSVYL